MKQGKISVFYYQLMIVTACTLFNHVLVIPYVLRSAYRDAWVSALFSGVPALVLAFLFYIINKKKKHHHINTWLQKQIGKPLTYIVIFTICIYLFVNVYITQKELLTWVNLTFMPQTPTIVLNIVFLLVCLYATLSGFKPLAILNGLLLPIIILLGFLVGIGNLQHKDYSLLFPIMEYGPTRILKGMLYPTVGFGQLFICVLLTHKLKTEFSFKSIFLTSLTLIFLTIGPLTGVIAEFGPFEAERLRFPAFEEWSLLNFGRFIEHVDFFSIYQWLSGAVIRISLFMFILVEILNITSKKKRLLVSILLFSLIFVAVTIPIDDMNFVNFIYYLFFPFSIIITVFITINLFIASLINRQ